MSKYAKTPHGKKLYPVDVHHAGMVHSHPIELNGMVASARTTNQSKINTFESPCHSDCDGMNVPSR